MELYLTQNISEFMVSFSSEVVHQLILKLFHQELTPGELNQFIATCQALSKVSLIHEIQNGRLNLNHSLIEPTQLDDFALDCIADLFARDDQGDLFLLRRFFEPQMDCLTRDPSSSLPALRQLIRSRVHQSLIALFCKVDIGGGKIWRNLSLVSKRDPEIKEFRFLNTLYYYFTESGKLEDPPSSLNPFGQPVPDEILVSQLQDALHEHYGLPQVVRAVLIDNRKNPHYQHFISRGQLYNLLKQLTNISQVELEDIENRLISQTDGTDGAGLTQYNIPIATLTAHLAEITRTKYHEKGKIDASQSHHYQQLMELYFTDLVSDGFVEKLPHYVKLTGSQILMSGQWPLHRGRLEYLIKLGKSWLQNYVEGQGFLKNSKMKLNR